MRLNCFGLAIILMECKSASQWNRTSYSTLGVDFKLSQVMNNASHKLDAWKIRWSHLNELKLIQLLYHFLSYI